MSGGDRGVDDETTEQPVASAWTPATPAAPEPPPDSLAPPQPIAPPVSESPSAWQPPPPRNWTPPPQQGWTPQQQQGWAPPQQSGWNPPQQGWAQGYPGQSPYWAPPQYRSSPLAVIAGVLLIISGVLMTLIGLLLLVVGAGSASFIAEIDPIMADEAGAIAAVILAVAVIVLIVGILEIVGAIGVFIHKSWGRWAGIVTASVGLVLGLLLLIGTFAPPAGSAGDSVIAIVWLGANGFIAAALAVAGDHFRPVYPPRG